MKTRHWIIYLFVWVAYYALLFCFASCKTKTVTQDRYLADRTVSKETDYNWQERFVSAFEQMARLRTQEHETSVKESIHVKDSTSTTVDQNGKPVKTESWHSYVSNRDSKDVLRLRDSVNILKSDVNAVQQLVVQRDSLIRLKQDSIFILSRNLTKAERRSDISMKATHVVIWVFIIGLAIWRWHRKK